ncbi:DUF2868 domain-containing protein [Pseudomonas sp. GCM10022188]|uniref:DUF2868 domain-containing protein n=1 Tax=Pseudomonas TaxID=286 RepID=UPI001E3D740B|nr:DUF2868 domain-containing protein [Pseudomonas oryzagri]MCC6074450.1 DUF2868 domain-containing protein [Pseudomonas oryzagri]
MPLTPIPDALWLAEALRLAEEQGGPLEDAEASRLARAAGGDLQRRILVRAERLAQRDGLDQALRHWRQGARLAVLLLAALAVGSGAGLAFAALGDGSRPVNLLWALGSLLGLHLVTLAGWALGFAFGGEAGSALGRLWLGLSERLLRDRRGAQLGPALLGLLARQGLQRWALGLLSHGLWLLALLAALAVLLAQLATRRYGFVWETTLLPADSFAALIHGLGAGPALLGFPQPDLALLRASGEAVVGGEAARQTWAAWLLGVFALYGLLPRALLALLCLVQWRRGLARLALDLEQPGYSRLRERLLPSSERLGVSDLAPAQLHQPHAGHAATTTPGGLLVAVELDGERAWPPALPAGVRDAGILDDGAQRRRLLEQLSRQPPARLLIACDPRRSPDRGTLALLGELARAAGATRIWLLPAPSGETLDQQRLGDWQAALDELQLPWNDRATWRWLESGDD